MGNPYAIRAGLNAGPDRFLATSVNEATLPALVPQPRSLEMHDGSFSIAGDIFIGASRGVENERLYLLSRLADTLNADPVSGTQRRISLQLDAAERDCGAEGYRLTVTPTDARICARTTAGVFYGIQTLLQLIEQSPQGFEIPCCQIEDSPEFVWRGLMLDVARHFLPVDFVKRMMDLMAMHKLNTLHLHLTDDQGWRIAIDAYPKLTEIGSVRTGAPVDPALPPGRIDAEVPWRPVTPETPDSLCHILPPRVDGRPEGGFYTKGDVRDIVAYAADRHINIVPEIEMPGHVHAALACYPDLSCTGGPFAVSEIWQGSEEAYCAGSESVFTFLDTVLEEVMALFPSRLIHIGGDECVKARWKACPKCQIRMRDEGLVDEEELQSWFIRRVQRSLAAHGRRLIGWDEILQGGLAPDATVMSWRGVEGGIAAAKAGHDVVMAPMQWTYYNIYQAPPRSEPPAFPGLLTLRDAYEWKPIPDELMTKARAHILGVQAQLWAEFLPTPGDVEYVAFPRACALAETAWGTSKSGDYADFERRLGAHLQRMDAMGVKYRSLDTSEPYEGQDGATELASTGRIFST